MRSQACAKFIISGEYSVLNGAPCLVYPLTEQMIVIEAQAKKNTDIFLENKTLEPQLKEKFLLACENIGLNESFLKENTLYINSNIPIGSGLGSSAALCVALARMAFPSADKNEIFEKALKGETVFHGKPSGADPACSAYATPLLYSYDIQTHQRSLKEFKSATDAPFVWLLRDSKEKHRTKELIDSINQIPENEKSDIFDELNEHSLRVPKIIEEGLWSELAPAIQNLSKSLYRLKIVTPRLENTLQSLMSDGALASKSTGSGGGGFALGLFEKSVAQNKKREGDIIISFSAKTL